MAEVLFVLLGIFMVGAYQDIMGDLHNLFGRVNEVHVFMDPDEACGYYVEEIIEGNTILPPTFPTDPISLLRIALKQALTGRGDAPLVTS